MEENYTYGYYYKVQAYGIERPIFSLIRKWSMKMTTAAKPGSTVGCSFKLWEGQDR
jgi:hypothetical protein